LGNFSTSLNSSTTRSGLSLYFYICPYDRIN